MKKILKLLMVVIMVLGITLSILNFISVDNMAKISFPTPDDDWGTEDDYGECTGRPHDCKI